MHLEKESEPEPGIHLRRPNAPFTSIHPEDAIESDRIIRPDDDSEPIAGISRNEV